MQVAPLRQGSKFKKKTYSNSGNSEVTDNSEISEYQMYQIHVSFTTRTFGFSRAKLNKFT